MDLIYTNADKVDQGVLAAYTLDLVYGEGAGDNNFEITLGKNEPLLDSGALIYIDGTEYGGMVDALRSGSNSDTRVSLGRTWHGILDSKVIEPDAGEDYFTVSGDANTILAQLVARLGLGDLFTVPASSSGITVEAYSFERYVKAYAGIRAMLSGYNAKPRIRWIGTMVELTAEPIMDYTDRPVDGDEAVVTVERHDKKVNHLICLGQGDLADRTVLHLYADQFGRIGTTKYFTGLEERTEIYDNANAKNLKELREEGTERFEELRSVDSVDVIVNEDSGLEYDIGDIIGGTDTTTGNTAQAVVTQKVVKIENGAISIDYSTK